MDEIRNERDYKDLNTYFENFLSQINKAAEAKSETKIENVTLYLFPGKDREVPVRKVDVKQLIEQVKGYIGLQQPLIERKELEENWDKIANKQFLVGIIVGNEVSLKAISQEAVHEAQEIAAAITELENRGVGTERRVVNGAVDVLDPEASSALNKLADKIEDIFIEVVEEQQIEGEAEEEKTEKKKFKGASPSPSRPAGPRSQQTSEAQQIKPSVGDLKAKLETAEHEAKEAILKKWAEGIAQEKERAKKESIEKEKEHQQEKKEIIEEDRRRFEINQEAAKHVKNEQEQLNTETTEQGEAKKGTPPSHRPL